MGYLDKSTITVDAILTNRGRELLSQGTGVGNFQITKFAVSDDEVDYGLYNTAHPLGSNYYGAVIENMPVLEATPDETQIMRYKLVTVTDSDLTTNVIIPQLQIKGTSIPSTKIVPLYFNATQGSNTITIQPETTYTSGKPNKVESQYTLLLADGSLAKVQVTNPSSPESTPNSRGSVIANGLEFLITAEDKSGTTTVTIFGGESGAVYNFTLTVTASS